MKLDVEKFIGEIQEYIRRATKPLSDKVKQLETDNAELKALLEQKPDYDSIVSDVLRQIPAPENGKDGKDGKDTDPELIKELVDKAVSEIYIPEPKHGQDGRDALDLEILPEIDETKSYPRNTYATYRGGLFKSFEKTNGMRGWECVVDGVTEVEMQQKDERTFSITSKFASGKETVKEFSVPVQIYRGVFRPGEYKTGDTATWGGSLWYCNEDTSDKPGEVGSKGWTLAAKRGRDGKDGRNGIDRTAPAKTGDKK